MKELVLTVGGTKIQTPTDVNALGNLSLSSLIRWGVMTLLVVSVILTLFFLVSGGIDMVTSGGDKQKVVNSRHKLTFAVVGLIIVLLSFFIVNLVGGFFGLDIFTPNPVCQGDTCITP